MGLFCFLTRILASFLAVPLSATALTQVAPMHHPPITKVGHSKNLKLFLLFYNNCTYILYTVYTIKKLMKILISNASAEPIYFQIVNQIKHQILSGELAEGSALPSIRKLAMELQISVITTKRAYEDLEKEGLINSVAGRGMFVATQNLELVREKKMKVVEEKLAEAVALAQLHGIAQQDLTAMLNILFEDK